MSRAGYSDDCSGWALIRYRGAVNSAIKGKRGQAFLKEALSLLDTMPTKELVEGELEADGKFCTLGIVGRARGIDLSKIDTYDAGSLSGKLNIAEVLAREVMYVNDESISNWTHVMTDAGWERVPVGDAGAKRWTAVRKWIVGSILTSQADALPDTEGGSCD